MDVPAEQSGDGQGLPAPPAAALPSAASADHGGTEPGWLTADADAPDEDQDEDDDEFEPL